MFKFCIHHSFPYYIHISIIYFSTYNIFRVDYYVEKKKMCVKSSLYNFISIFHKSSGYNTKEEIFRVRIVHLNGR